MSCVFLRTSLKTRCVLVTCMNSKGTCADHVRPHASTRMRPRMPNSEFVRAPQLITYCYLFSYIITQSYPRNYGVLTPMEPSAPWKQINVGESWMSFRIRSTYMRKKHKRVMSRNVELSQIPSGFATSHYFGSVPRHWPGNCAIGISLSWKTLSTNNIMWDRARHCLGIHT